MNKLYSLFVKLFILRKQPYLIHVPVGLLWTNWFFQRILKINDRVPFQVHYTSRLDGCTRIKINGDPAKVMTSFAVSGGCYYSVSGNATVEIGEGTIWAFNFNLQTSNHKPFDLNEAIEKDIKIGKNCWIAGNVTITAGVELGDNVVVGANSVVTKSFPSNVVIAGCPAKIIKELRPLETSALRHNI